MKNILLGTIALGLASASAFAADLPSRAAPAALAPAPVFTWTGFYVGASVGAVGLTSDVKGWNDVDNGYDVKGTGGGALAGVGFGYNYQMGNIVLGVEADLSGVMGAVEKSGYGPIGTYGDSNLGHIGSKMTVFGTVRGRVGVAFDRTLVYATGGLAVANYRHTYQNEYDTSYYLSSGATRTGWVVGVGIEQALSASLSLKLDALYADFGTKKFTAPDNDVVNIQHFKDTALVARVGLNYRFGGSAAPVVARY